MSLEDDIAELRRASAERAARVRRGWLWLAGALVCALAFFGTMWLGVRLNFPWWVLGVEVVCEVGAFVCVGRSGRSRRARDG